MKYKIGDKIGNLTLLYPSQKMTADKREPLYWICKCDCGNKIEITTACLHQGKINCGKCYNASDGEKTIKNILIENNIDFIIEKTFNNFYAKNSYIKYKYDFFINNNNYIIEYDGNFHFFNNNEDSNPFLFNEKTVTRKRDKIKNAYCFNNNIPLIRIPYYYKPYLTIQDLKLDTSKFIITPTNEINYYNKFDNWNG